MRNNPRGRHRRCVAVVAAIVSILGAAAPKAIAAEEVKIGVLNAAAVAPVLLAADRGYFASEGLEPKIVRFDAAQPIALAVVSGDLDFGYAGVTGAFFSLAGQGGLKIVAGAYSEHAGFHYNALIASKRASQDGLTSLRELPSHSFALPQIGSPPHYAVGKVAEKLGFDLKSLRLLPLESIPNVLSAIVGGQADAAMAPASFAQPLLERGDATMLAWLSDEISWQIGVVFTATKTANLRADFVRRTLRALGKGQRDYAAAFIGSDGSLHEGPTSAETLDALAKDLNQKPDQVRLGLVYIDAEGRLDEADVLSQIAWYKAQGMLKGEIDGAKIIDTRYVAPLREK